MLFLLDEIGGLPAFIPATVATFLGSARLMGMMIAFPLFTQAQIEGLFRFAIVVAFSLPVIIGTFPSVADPGSIGWLKLLMLGVKEVIIGVILGVAFALPFWAVQTVGDLVDSARGATQSNVTDPVNANETSVFGAALLLIGLLIFTVSDGLFTLLRALYESYKAWPVLDFAPVFNSDLVVGFGLLIAELIRLGFIIGTPLLLGLFIVDLTLAFVGRLASQLQISDMGYTLKNLLFVCLLPIYMMFFAHYIMPQFPKIADAGIRFLGFR
jgi:type III secretion protein T